VTSTRRWGVVADMSKMISDHIQESTRIVPPQSEGVTRWAEVRVEPSRGDAFIDEMTGFPDAVVRMKPSTRGGI
jgi:hypothetical protein